MNKEIFNDEIIRKLIYQNCKRTNLDTITFLSKNPQTIDVYKILNLVNRLKNELFQNKKIDELVFKLNFSNIPKIIVEDNFEVVLHKEELEIIFEHKNKKRILSSLNFWLNFFIESNINFNNLEIKINDIKKIYLEPDDICNLFISKLNEIQLKIQQFNEENAGDLDFNILDQDFFTFLEKEIFNFFVFVFFKKESIDKKELIILINDELWLENNFFKSFYNHLFNNKEKLNYFWENINIVFRDYFNFLKSHIEWMNWCIKFNVEWDKFKTFNIENLDIEKKENFNFEENEKNKIIETKAYSFYDLLQILKHSKISISYYQRSYIWTNELIKDLFNNINNCNLGHFHYLNHILVEKNLISAHTTSQTIFEVIDGQQRIISLLIIFIVCIKFAFMKQFEIKKEYLNFLQPKLSIKDNFLYSPSDIGEKLKQLLEFNFQEIQPKEKLHFTSNVLEIMTLVPHYLKKQKDHQLFLEKLMNNFVFSFTTIDKSKSNINIFSTFKNLNSKSVPLNSLDLLNSHIFHKNENDLSVKILLKYANREIIHHTNEREIHKSILPEYEKFKNNISKLLKNSRSPEKIIRNFNKTIYLGGLNKNLKEKFSNQNSIITNFSNLEQLIKDESNKNSKNNFLNDLKKINMYFEKYLKLFNKEELKNSKNPLIKNNLDYLITFSNKDVYKPFIYKLFEIINENNDRGNLKWIREILYILETFIIRTSIYQPGLSYTVISNKLLNIVDECIEKNKKFTYKDLSSILQDHIPNDDKLKKEFKARKYILNDKDITKLILARMEIILQKGNFKIWDKDEMASTIFFERDYEIEHIIAKKNKNFKSITDSDTDELKEKIGNKILLTSSENKSLGNKTLQEKIKSIFEDEGIMHKKIFLADIPNNLNKYFDGEENFKFESFVSITQNNEDTNLEIKKIIENRSEKFLNWISLIWNQTPGEWMEQINNNIQKI